MVKDLTELFGDSEGNLRTGSIDGQVVDVEGSFLIESGVVILRPGDISSDYKKEIGNNAPHNANALTLSSSTNVYSSRQKGLVAKTVSFYHIPSLDE